MSAIRCAPGVIAYVVAPAPAWLHGIIVTILKAGDPPACGYLPQDQHLARAPHWVVKTSKPMLGFDEKTRCMTLDTEFCVPEPCLRPIAGDGASNDSHQAQPVEAPAEVAA